MSDDRLSLRVNLLDPRLPPNLGTERRFRALYGLRHEVYLECHVLRIAGMSTSSPLTDRKCSFCGAGGLCEAERRPDDQPQCMECWREWKWSWIRAGRRRVDRMVKSDA